MTDEIIKEIVSELINKLEDKKMCIICNQQTEYKRGRYIENVGCYVNGLVQLCGPCYLSFRNTSTTYNLQEI
jgi:hypothetical protein